MESFIDCRNFLLLPAFPMIHALLNFLPAKRKPRLLLSRLPETSLKITKNIKNKVQNDW